MTNGEVWLVKRSAAGRLPKLHDNEECPHLRKASAPVVGPKPRDRFPNHEDCQYCAGEFTSYRSTDGTPTYALRDKLLEMDAEEVLG